MSSKVQKTAVPFGTRYTVDSSHPLGEQLAEHFPDNPAIELLKILDTFHDTLVHIMQTSGRQHLDEMLDERPTKDDFMAAAMVALDMDFHHFQGFVAMLVINGYVEPDKRQAYFDAFPREAKTTIASMATYMTFMIRLATSIADESSQ